MYHYTYRITHIEYKKHYYGVRTSKSHPKEDLGKKYFSSSSNKEFIKDQKNNPLNYKYKCIRIYNTRDEAMQLEIDLHNRFNVGVNESFYNKSKATSTGFCTFGVKFPGLGGHLFNDNGTLKQLIYDKMCYHQRENPSMKGKKQTEKQKEIASKTHKGKIISEEQKQKTKSNENFIKSRKYSYEQSLKKYYENNQSPCQKSYDIFNNRNKVIFKFDNISLRNFCKINKLPYAAMYKSVREDGSPLYQTDYSLNRAKKKGFDKYKGWCCKESIH